MRRTTMLLILTLALLSTCSKGGKTPTAPTGAGGGGGGNHAPTVNLNIDKTVLNPNQTATLSATTADADGDQVTLAWRAGRGTVQSSGPTATTATYTAPSAFGSDSVVATASDGHGGSGQATAHTYVRNPSPPVFTFGGTGSASCGVGTAVPTGFNLTLTPAEDVLITSIRVQSRDCPVCSYSHIRDYSPPLSIRAGTTYVWTDFCIDTQCCAFNGCGSPCAFWAITIIGSRPAPDGGSFYYQCPSWSGGTNCY